MSNNEVDSISSQVVIEGETEKITPYQWKIMGTAVAGYIFDGFDSILFTLCLPAILHDFNLTAVTGGLMVTIFLLGQVFGGITCGIIADYLGRKNTLILTIIIYAFSTGMCAFAWNWQSLAFFRFFTGFGCVGEWAVAATLIAETWPAKHRSKAGSVMQSCWAWGSILGALVVMFVQPAFGWRAVFLVGVLPALIVLYIRRHVKETERFEAEKARRADLKSRGVALQNTVVQLFKEPVLRKYVAIGAALTSAELIVTWAFLTFSPMYLSTVRGFDIVKSSSWFIVYNLGAAAGYLLWGPIADRIGRKPTFVIYILCSMIFTPLFMLWAPTTTWLMVCGAMAGFGTLGIYSGFTVYYPELFPTRLRATGTTFAPQLGRIISVAGPFVIGSMAVSMGYGLAISLACLCWLWALFALFFAPETKGKVLEDI
ncbi:MAG: MFS transporter [Desulfitobacterium sp.]